MNAAHPSPISVGNLFKWFTIMMLFVVCGCLFINVRSQQVTKKRLIEDLITDQADTKSKIQKAESEIKASMAPGVLEELLNILDSPLGPVAIEETEDLSPRMTVSRLAYPESR